MNVCQGLKWRVISAIVMMCLWAATPVSAQVREADAAQRLADSFWPMKRGGENAKPEMVYTEQDTVSKHPFFYIFNRGENQGYVIISADERSKKIIGYSDTGTFDPENVPAEMRAWLRVCRQELQQLSVTPDSLLKMDLGQFVLSKGRSKGSQAFAASVSPLLGQINYSQSFPYNALCPQVSGQSCVTGCVATAAVQIMRYWEYPKQPTGQSHSYLLNGQSIGTTFNTYYDWTNMLGTYDSYSGTQQQQQAIARLMADAGIACDMDYSPSESGAYTNKMALGMVDYFGYDKGVIAYQRTDFTQADFVYYLKRELNAGRPVLVSGTGSGGGHCFVCDGYDAAGLFHINWGWNGMSNGYFELANLSPSALGTGGGTGGFNDEVVFFGGLQPPRTHSKAVYVLSFQDLDASLSLRKGKKFSYTIGHITNPSLYTYSGQVGVGLYQDGQLVDVLGTSEITLEPGYVCPSLEVKAKIPSGLDDGEYQLVMVCKADNDDSWRACLNNNCNCIAILVNGKSVDGTFDYATHYLDLPDNGFDHVASNTSTTTTTATDNHTTYTDNTNTASPTAVPASAALMLTQPLQLPAGNQLANGNQSVAARLLAGNNFTGKVGVFIYDNTLQNCVATLQAGTISLPANQENNCTFSGVLNLPDGNYYACLFYVDGNGQWGQVPQYEYSCAAFSLSDSGHLPPMVSSYANVMPGEGGAVEDHSGDGGNAATTSAKPASGTFVSMDTLDDHFYDDVEEDSTQSYSFDDFGEEVFSKAVNDKAPFTCQRFRVSDKDLIDAGGRMVYSFRLNETAKLSFELLNKHEKAQKTILTLSLFDKDDHWVTDLAERQIVIEPKSTLKDVFAVRLVDVVPGAYKLRLTQAASTAAVSKPVVPAASSSMLIQIVR